MIYGVDGNASPEPPGHSSATKVGRAQMGSSSTNGMAISHQQSGNSPNPFRFYEFFAGAGLVRLAVEPSWSCIWANDNDPRKAEVYERQFGSEEFVLGDVAKVQIDQLPRGADMAWASFPCQDLSLAGWRRGMAAERSGTFWEFWRLMRDLFDQGRRPPLIVIENVSGMLYGKDFAGLCEALSALGMQFGPLVIDASRFLPQSRPRVFVVAVDWRIDCAEYLDGEPQESPWFTKAVNKAFREIPVSLQERWRWWKLPEPFVKVPSIGRVIQQQPVGVAWHTPEETQRLLDMMTETNLKKVTDAKARGRGVGFVYKRIRTGVQRAEARFDGLSGCLRTPQGGSSRQTVLMVDAAQVRSRLLSSREAARLMGVPDSFWLPPRYNDAYRAMGDGVAVPAVRWLSGHLLEPLAGLCRAAEGNFQGVPDGAASERWLASRQAAEALAGGRAAVDQ